MHTKGRSVTLVIKTGLFVLLGLFVVFTSSFFVKLSANYKSQQQHTTTLDHMLAFKESISSSSQYLDRYMESGNMLTLNDLAESLNEGDALLGKLISSNRQTSFLMEAIRTSYQAFEEMCRKTYTLKMENEEAVYQNRDMANTIATYISRYCDDLLAIIIAQSLDRQRGEQKILAGIIAGIGLYATAFLAIAIVILYLFSAWVKHPLELFAAKAKTISQGELGQPVHLPHTDKRVVQLVDAFNSMQEEIKEKVEAEQNLAKAKQKNAEYQAAIDKATLAFLQSQTNPHFLFNTLNSISRTITLGKLDEAQNMLSSLARLMRYNLTDPNEPALLEEEVEITEQYLRIQAMRFGDRLSWSIHSDPLIAGSVMIPRFTIQPLVENAIIHGLSPLERRGHIMIDITSRPSGVLLRIADDGVGIEKETLHKLCTFTSNRIGIANTLRRLELFYGTKNPMEIISRPGRGTMIIMHLKEDMDVQPVDC